MEPSPRPIPDPLPTGLPPPIDDGAALHLDGRALPDLELPSSDGRAINLKASSEGHLVLYVFPKMGSPGEADPHGWDDTPGARGCTQQNCAFRDREHRFDAVGYEVAGLSAQPIEELQEAARRLHLRFPLLADPQHRLGDALDLPTFEVEGMTFYKRLTLVAERGRIVKVFYPVFPPDRNPEEVLSWIGQRQNRADD